MGKEGKRVGWLRRLLAVIIGLVFIFSGILKIMDPVGTGLIVSEHLKFLHLWFMRGAAPVFGVLLALVEASLGAALVTGVYRKTVAITTLSLLGLFTLLTALLLIRNPEMGCGCFGEAVNMTHLQSFLKNIILLVLSVGAFVPFSLFGDSPRRRYVAFWILVPLFAIALLYSYSHLPPMDFTTMAPGTEICSESAETAMPEAEFIYSKDGIEERFTLDDLPDSSWTFVRVGAFDNFEGAGASVPVRNASLEDADTLLTTGKVIVFPVHRPSSANWNRILRGCVRAGAAGARPVVLVASTPEEIDSMDVPLELPLYYSDYKPLITLCRANGGAVLLSDGYIVAKWAPSDLPGEEKLKAFIEGDPVEMSSARGIHTRLVAEGFAIAVLSILIFV